MLVTKIMSRDVVTVVEGASLEEAATLMKEHDIRHLPVVRNSLLVGLVTERDVRGALFPSLIEEITVKDLMIANPVTVGPDSLLEDAARVIYQRKIGCLPVVDDDGDLLGIVTVADMLAALIELMGFLSSSSRLDVILTAADDSLEKAVRIIQQEGGRVLGVSLTQLRKDKPVHLFRLQKTDLTDIIEKLSKAGYEVISSLG
jgi:acetoin utilization protein AcuB